MVKKNALASAIATSFIAAAAVGSAHAATLGDKGQVLMGAAYMVDQGYNTIIRVVNTNQNAAVKAKLVLRSKKDSQECRDVMLYLSPADVAEIRITDLAGDAYNATVTSTDDSLLNAAPSGDVGSFATEAAPYSSKTVSSRLMSTADTCKVGHIEVVEAYQVPNGIYTVPAAGGVAATAVEVKRGMTKANLFKLLRTDPTAGAALTRAAVEAANPGRPFNSVNVSDIVGVVDLEKVDGSDRISYKMDGLTSAASDMIGCASYDETVGKETLIGTNWDALCGGDTVDVIDQALNDTLMGVYENKGAELTNVLVTFPTKYRYVSKRGVFGSINPADATTYGPLTSMGVTKAPFGPSGAYQYATTSFDMSENTGSTIGCFESPCGATSTTWMNDEVNYIQTSGISSFWFANANSGDKKGRGWFSMAFIPSSGSNAAVIGASHHFNGTQSSFVSFTR